MASKIRERRAANSSGGKNAVTSEPLWRVMKIFYLKKAADPYPMRKYGHDVLGGHGTPCPYICSRHPFPGREGTGRLRPGLGLPGLGLLCWLLLLSSSSLAAPPKPPAYVWQNVPIGGGGYVLDVYCQPQQRNLVYIRTDVGGFFRWDAKNLRWIPLTDMFTEAQDNFYGGEGMALDPTNPNIVYIAAGKYTWSSPGTIFKSFDQGRTWHKLPIDLPMGGNEDQRWGGERLVVNPHNPSILLFGSRKNGLWRSGNAGKLWAKVVNFPVKMQNGIGVNAVAFDPKNANIAYASAYGDGVYQSRDDGVTWQRTPLGPSRVERLACGSDGALYATQADGVAKYAARQWADMTPPGVHGAFCGLAVDPKNPADILATPEGNRLRLFRSQNGGASWAEIVTQTKSSVPWYSPSMKQLQSVAGVAFDPLVPGRVWLTDWYATYETDNINESPVVLQNHEMGHEELVVFTMAAPPGGPQLLSGVADVDGFVHGSLSAFPAHGLGDYYGGTGPAFGDTDQIAWCAGQPSRVARVGVRRWDNTGGVAISHDGGRTWANVPNWDTHIMPGRIAISATDPNNMVVLRIHSGPALVTRDGGKTWHNITALPDDLDPDVWNWQVPLAADGAQPGVFYVCAGGKLYKSIDAGLSFTVSASGLPGSMQALLSAPGRAGDLWLAAGSGGLYHSTDGGAAFHKIASVSDAPLFALGKAAPGRADLALYLDGTLANGQRGIFQSIDDGASWQKISDSREPIGDAPNCMAASFSTYGLVFIGTNGRGIYYGEPR
jgi:xyloglucan-specific exo-beta-1,4-glucanase